MRTHYKLNTYVDAEWASDGHVLSLQVLVTSPNAPAGRYFILNEKYYRAMVSKGYYAGYNRKQRAFISYCKFQDSKDILSQILQDYILDYELFRKASLFTTNLYFFYSPKDLWISFGWNKFNWLLQFKNPGRRSYIRQKRAISGSFQTKLPIGFPIIYTFKDLRGWTNSGLSALSESLGLNTETKNILNDYKGEMEVALVKHTHDFIRYGLNDGETFEFEFKKEKASEFSNFVLNADADLFFLVTVA